MVRIGEDVTEELEYTEPPPKNWTNN
jgi:hypothetical protein